MKNHIPYGQFLRPNILYTKEKHLELAIGNIRQTFIDRGYPQKIIDEQKGKVKINKHLRNITDALTTHQQ